MSVSDASQILIVIVGGVIGSIIGTYALSKFVDIFCSTNVDAAIIRRIEELNQGRPDKNPAILKGMEMEERFKVLEKVLDSRVSC